MNPEPLVWTRHQGKLLRSIAVPCREPVGAKSRAWCPVPTVVANTAEYAERYGPRARCSVQTVRPCVTIGDHSGRLGCDECLGYVLRFAPNRHNRRSNWCAILGLNQKAPTPVADIGGINLTSLTGHTYTTYPGRSTCSRRCVNPPARYGPVNHPSSTPPETAGDDAQTPTHPSPQHRQGHQRRTPTQRRSRGGTEWTSAVLRYDRASRTSSASVDFTEWISAYGRRNEFRRNPPLCRGDGEEMPLAGHALELVRAAILELES